MDGFNRTKNAKRNIIWGFVAKIIALLGPFLTRTLMLYYLGAAYPGVNSLYISVLQVLSLAELGFGSAVTYSMYKPVAEGSTQEVAAYLNYFRRVYRVVGLVILVLGLAMLPVLHFFVKAEWPPDVDLQLCFLIYLGNATVSYFLFAYKQSLLHAHQRSDVVNKANIIVMVAQFTFQSIMLVTAPNFYTFAIALPVATITSNLLIAWFTGRLFPEYSEASLRACRLSDDARREVRKRVAGLVFQQVCGTTRNSFDTLVISAFIGVTAVTCYGNYYLIMSGVTGIMIVVISAITPSAGNSVAVESKAKNFADCRLFMFLYAMIAVVCTACLVCLYQPFMRIWVGEELMLPFIVPVLMAAYFYVLTMGDIRYMYATASGIWWELRWLALVESVMNLVLNLVFVQWLGLPGVVLATLLNLFFINFVYGSRLTFRHYFGMEYMKPFYLDHAVYLGVCAGVCAVTYLVCGLLPDGGIVLWLAKAAVCIVCAAGLLVVCFGWTKRFREALEFAKRVLRRG